MKLNKAQNNITLEMSENESELLLKIVSLDDSVSDIVVNRYPSMSKERIITFCAKVHELLALNRLNTIK